MAAQEIRVPDIGEFTDVPIIEIHVAAGDTVAVEDPLLTLESDKATLDVPSPVAGTVSDNKGINLPGVAVNVPALSEKDEEDLRFALHLSVDFIALSFVRSPDDFELVRDIMRQEDISVPVIAKLEKPEAVDALEAMCSRSTR